MYERFTDRLRKVITSANCIARNYGSVEIKPEHMALALVRENDGAGKGIIERLSIDTSVIRRKLENLLEQKSIIATVMRVLPYSAQTRKLIADIQEYARTIPHASVGTEHLVYGLLNIQEGIIKQVLSEAGLTKEAYDKELRDFMSVR